MAENMWRNTVKSGSETRTNPPNTASRPTKSWCLMWFSKPQRGSDEIVILQCLLQFVLQIDREREGKIGKGKRMFSNDCSVIAGFLFIYNKKVVLNWTTFCKFWQGHKDLNPEPTVLETAALPIELYPYISKAKGLDELVGLQGLEPGTIRLWAGGSDQLS